MKAYKLFRKYKDGIASLFINNKETLPIGEWMDAEPHPTYGYKFRPYWHCSPKPVAPHLKMKLANGEERVWYEVEIEDFEEMDRPESQGGTWYLAKRIRIVKEILPENLLGKNSLT